MAYQRLSFYLPGGVIRLNWRKQLSLRNYYDFERRYSEHINTLIATKVKSQLHPTVSLARVRFIE